MLELQIKDIFRFLGRGEIGAGTEKETARGISAAQGTF